MHKADVLPRRLVVLLRGAGWGDCPYIFTLSPARDSHSSFTPDINEQWEPTGGRESVIKSWASAQKTLTFIIIALYTIQIVSNLIKRENIWINVAKFINFVTSSISGVKQLYRRQQCHYSAQFSSVLIQFTYGVNQWCSKSAPGPYAKILYGPPQMKWAPTRLTCWFFWCKWRYVTIHKFCCFNYNINAWK